MAKAQGLGMQMQAAGSAGISVDGIAHDGMAQFSQMGPQHAALVASAYGPLPSAAGTNGADPPDRLGQTPLGVAAVARRLARQARQGTGDATAAVELPLHICLVELVDPPFSKQGTEAAQGVSASAKSSTPEVSRSRR